MIRSGIAPLDDLIGGLVGKRVHVFTGGPGSGKTICALHFLREGLTHDESALYITSARPADVRSLARHIGWDLDAQLRGGRLAMLRFRTEFAARVAFVANAGPVFEDVQRMLGPVVPSRIVIDSFAPFLAEGNASGEGVTRLAEFLESSGATSLLTFPEDITVAYDRRLETVVQSAAAIVRLDRADADRYRLRVVNARFDVAAVETEFAIRRGQGIVPALAPEPLLADRLALRSRS